MIEQHHHNKARGMIARAGWGADKSRQWHEGLANAVAWHLAGSPLGYGRSACPYEVKTPERDAWMDGWMNGKATCQREGIGNA